MARKKKLSKKDLQKLIKEDEMEHLKPISFFPINLIFDNEDSQETEPKKKQK